MGQYMGTKEASSKWGYKQQTISNWCRKGMVSGAEQDAVGSSWRIPSDAKCPKKIKNLRENENEHI